MMLIHDGNNMLTFKWSPMHRASIWRPAPFLFVLDPHICLGQEHGQKEPDIWGRHVNVKTIPQTLLRESFNWNCCTFKTSSIWEASSGNNFNSATPIQAKKCPSRPCWGRSWPPACFAGLRRISLGFATSDSRKMKSARQSLQIKMTNERKAATNFQSVILQFHQSSLKTQKLGDGVRQSNLNRPCRALNSIPWSRILGNLPALPACLV